MAGLRCRGHRIGPSWQRWMTMPVARLRWVPLGVIGMLGTWNYPLFLNAPPIAQALAAGNAVIWKSSELSALCGAKLDRSLKEAGIPPGLVSVLQGGPDVGRSLAEADLDKGMFTGGVNNGRGVLASLGAPGIPAVAELSGFDPAIVLRDAPIENTIRALTWASFVGCGQTCVGVKRVYIVGEAEPWAEALATASRGLRIGDPASPGVNIGPMISAGARGISQEDPRVDRCGSDRPGRRRAPEWSRLVLSPDRPPRPFIRTGGCPRRSLRAGRRGPRPSRPTSRDIRREPERFRPRGERLES